MSDRYAVIGNPIAHSKSPEIHAAFAAETGEDIEYTRLLAPASGMRETAEAFRAEGGKGLNVTLPFKVEALGMANDSSERARAAGAANFLRATDAGWFADNTDGAGLLQDLRINLGVVLAGKKVLLTGAGGAARGVILPLLLAQPASLTVVNRTPEKASELARAFAAKAGTVRITGGSFASIAGSHFDLVINATAASLAGEAPGLPDGIYARDSVAYDMMYGDQPTAFVKAAIAQGAARAVDGLGMLVEQAAESFFLWRGVHPHTARVLDMLRRGAA